MDNDSTKIFQNGRRNRGSGSCRKAGRSRSPSNITLQKRAGAQETPMVFLILCWKIGKRSWTFVQWPVGRPECAFSQGKLPILSEDLLAPWKCCQEEFLSIVTGKRNEDNVIIMAPGLITMKHQQMLMPTKSVPSRSNYSNNAVCVVCYNQTTFPLTLHYVQLLEMTKSFLKYLSPWQSVHAKSPCASKGLLHVHSVLYRDIENEVHFEP